MEIRPCDRWAAGRKEVVESKAKSSKTRGGGAKRSADGVLDVEDAGIAIAASCHEWGRPLDVEIESGDIAEDDGGREITPRKTQHMSICLPRDERASKKGDKRKSPKATHDWTLLGASSEANTNYRAHNWNSLLEWGAFGHR